MNSYSVVSYMPWFSSHGQAASTATDAEDVDIEATAAARLAMAEGREGELAPDIGRDGIRGRYRRLRELPDIEGGAVPLDGVGNSSTTTASAIAY
jgi:hypothetical protein